MEAVLIFFGLILAGSDGAWFPIANFFGTFLMYVGCARLLARKERV